MVGNRFRLLCSFCARRKVLCFPCGRRGGAEQRQNRPELFGLVVDIAVRGLDVPVSEQFANNVHVRPGPPKPTGRRMLQIVKANRQDARPLDCDLQAVPDVPPLPWPRIEGEYHIRREQSSTTAAQAAISQTTILVGEVDVLVSFPEGCEEGSVLQGAVGV
jgi:hypothetical protein